MLDVFAHQPPVAIVLGVNRDRDVAQHGLRAHGGDDDVARSVDQRQPDKVQPVLALFRPHLDIGDARPAVWAPVDHARATVDVPLVVEAHEHRHDRPVVIWVEGKPFAGPVVPFPKSPELLGNPGPVRFLPLPRALDELLPPDFPTAGAFLRQQRLDFRVHRDARVIGAGKDERGEATHALVPPEDILDRVR